MSGQYKYSIIIPHRNRPVLLRKLIASIPISENIQIIIVDDCSDETTVEKVRNSFQDMPNVQLVFNTTGEAKGAGWARNIGINISSGKYLIFADSDDTFKENAFSIFDDIISEDEYDFAIFKASSTNKNGTETDRTRFTNFLVEKASEINQKEQHIVKEIISKIDAPWAKLIRRDMIVRNDIKFDEIYFSNDVMFNLKVLIEAEKIRICTKEVYNVLSHSSSLVNVKSEAMLDDRFDACIRFNKKFAAQNFSVNSYSVTGGYVLQAKRFGYSKMINFIKRSFKYNVRLFYPVMRYFHALFMKLAGVDPLEIRFYVVFGYKA